MGLVFGSVGFLIVLVGFYLPLNSLEVTNAGGDIRSTRRLLGIPIRNTIMRRSEFACFKKKVSSKTQSGKKHTVYYTLQAVDSNGRKITIGEGFKGANEARAAAELIAREFGLVPRKEPTAAAGQPDTGNFLAAD